MSSSSTATKSVGVPLLPLLPACGFRFRAVSCHTSGKVSPFAFAADRESLTGVLLLLELCFGVLVPLRSGVSSFLRFAERGESSILCRISKMVILLALRHGGEKLSALGTVGKHAIEARPSLEITPR
jgi:hypothetical protein